MGVEDRLIALEARLREAEDRLAIYQLIASYGPAADGMSRAGLEALWLADGTYETEHHMFRGAAEIGAIVEDPMHLDFVARGSAHVMSLPHIRISGDRAIATGYSKVCVRGMEGWTVVRAAANRWELERDDNDHWRVARRINRLLSGTAESRALLAQGIEGPASA